jgi:putative ribosome biogenesis GTPase RsgA
LLLFEQWEYPVARVIAANVDTLFIVSSLNEDFNLNRIERYLSLANEAQTQPVIILPKAVSVKMWKACAARYARAAIGGL